MQLEIAAETELFLLACLLGAGMGIIYDMLRVIRNTISHGKVFLFIEDFAYTILFGFAYFVFCTGLTKGIRGFVFVGMLVGCIIERLTVGNFVVLILSKFFGAIWRFVFAPITGFISKIAKLFHKRFVKKYLNFYKSKKNGKKPLKVDAELVYNNKN
ncbi:MAG: spore cortex biosynthesis protein YabQ [Oscillospiraceae bacterium]